MLHQMAKEIDAPTCWRAVRLVGSMLTCDVREPLSWKPTPAVAEPTNPVAGMPVPLTGGPMSAASAEASVTVGLDAVQVAVSDGVLPQSAARPAEDPETTNRAGVCRSRR